MTSEILRLSSELSTPFFGIPPESSLNGNISEVAPPTLRDAISNRLRDLIRERAGSVLQLELAMKKRGGFVSDALAGRKRLTLELVEEVLLHLGCRPDDLFRPAAGDYEPAAETAHDVRSLDVAYGAPDAEATRHLVAELGAAGAFAALVSVLLEKGVLTAADLAQAGDSGKKKV